MSATLGFMILISCSDDLRQCNVEHLTNPYFTSASICDEALEDNMLNVGAPQIFGVCIKVPGRTVTMADLDWRVTPQGDLLVKRKPVPTSVLVATR